MNATEQMTNANAETIAVLHGRPDIHRVGVDLLSYLAEKGEDAVPAHTGADMATLMIDKLGCTSCRDSVPAMVALLLATSVHNNEGRSELFTVIMALATIGLTADTRINNALAIINANSESIKDAQVIIDALTGADNKDGMRNSDGS